MATIRHKPKDGDLLTGEEYEADDAHENITIDGGDITTGTVADARIASTIARDSEVTAAIAALSTVYQPLDSDLTAVAALSTTSFGRSLLALADQAALLAAAGAAASGHDHSGTYQPADSDLTAIAALTTTAFGRGLLELANAAALLSAAGAAAASHLHAGGDITSGTVADGRVASTLARDSEVSSAVSTHESALDPHPGYTTAAEVVAYAQPLDSDLTALAALTTTAYGRALLELANAAALRTAGGLVIGTDVQAYDADLAAIAALSTTSYGRSLLEAANAGALRTLAGLVIGTDVQAYDAELAALAGLTSAADRLPYFSGSAAAALATFTAAGRALVDDADASAQLTTLGVSTFIKTLLDDADAATARATLGISAGSSIPSQALAYPTSASGDDDLGTSAAGWSDVGANALDVLSSDGQAITMTVLGASKNSTARKTLGTTKAAAFDFRFCLIPIVDFFTSTLDTYVELLFKTSGGTQVAAMRFAATDTRLIAIGGGGSSTPVNTHSALPHHTAITCRVTRDGSDVVRFYVAAGSPPFALQQVRQNNSGTYLAPLTFTSSGTIARVEVHVVSAASHSSTASFGCILDYFQSV